MGKKQGTKMLCHVVVTALVCTSVMTPMDTMAAKKAKLTKKSLVIQQGSSKKIGIKNKKSKAKYTFKASNKKIKVTKTGKVSALKVGTAKVVVTETYKKKKRKVGTVSIKVTAKKGVTSTEKPTVSKNPLSAAPSAAATVAPSASASTAPGGASATPDESTTPETSAIPTASSTPEASVAPTETPKGDPTQTVVYNNYFEDGDTKGFTGRGSSIEISQSENHTDGGMNSLLCTGRSASWHGASLSISKFVEVGTSYDFSAWVKQDTGEEQEIALKLQYNDKEGNTQYKSVISGVTGGVACASGTWVQLSGSYVIPEADGDISLYLEMSTDTASDFLVDDVVITGKQAEDNGYKVTDEVYAEMKANSLLSSGNNARLKQVIEKAQNGDDVTLAYIGGSITEGALASPNSKCYAEVSANAFAAKYGKDGGANVHFINAGMSGTPSDIGVVRYNRDVIERLPEGSDHPDILFIEFAVNDYGTATGGGGYEGLIRQALKSGSAVVLIFSVFKSEAGGRVMENSYRPYGEYYDLPMISMGDAIVEHFREDGFYDWYFGDSLHPNNTGYQLMSDCIMNLMETVEKEAAEEDNIKDVDAMDVVKTAAYQGIKMIDAKTVVADDAALKSIEAGGFTETDSATGSFQYEYNGAKGAAWFPDNWMHDDDGGSEALKITANCKTLMFVYKLSNSSSYGSADLYIDGVKKETLSCYDQSGWNNGKVYVAMTEDVAAEHVIELKMADGDEEKKFTLLAIGYN